MHLSRTYLLLLLLAGLMAVIAGCGAAPIPQEADAIQTAVEATLTAVAEAAAPTETPAAAEATAGPAAPTPQTADVATPEPVGDIETNGQPVVLPPKLANFNPTDRPLATLGDPDAPVVMYEWSDYT